MICQPRHGVSLSIHPYHTLFMILPCNNSLLLGIICYVYCADIFFISYTDMLQNMNTYYMTYYGYLLIPSISMLFIHFSLTYESKHQQIDDWFLYQLIIGINALANKSIVTAILSFLKCMFDCCCWWHEL